jgi:NAD(P)-dependent dehydrogenase (short-subunit alcohol dehydrogenase family)
VDLELRGKSVLVTGGSHGIGRATALAFAAEGADIALTYHSDRDAAEGVVRDIEADGARAVCVPMSLSDHASVASAAAATDAAFGGIDVLVANAVQWPTQRPAEGRFENIEAPYWREMIAANVEGTVATIAAVLPFMRARGWGRIVLVSSSVAEEGVPGPSPYGVAKSAYLGIARQLTWDVGRDGILVTVVGTGFTVTERNLERFPDSARQAVAAHTPSRRLSVPEDVAKLIVFLGSAGNANITGEIVYDGSSNGRSGHLAALAG